MRPERAPWESGYGVLLKLREAVAFYRPLLEQLRNDDKEALERMVNDFRIVFYFGVLEQLLRQIGLPIEGDDDGWDPEREAPFGAFQVQLLQSYPQGLSPMLKKRLDEAKLARHWFAHPSPEKSPPVPREREKASHNLGSIVFDLIQRLDEWSGSQELETDLVTADAKKVPELFYDYLSRNTRLKPRTPVQSQESLAQEA